MGGFGIFDVFGVFIVVIFLLLRFDILIPKLKIKWLMGFYGENASNLS